MNNNDINTNDIVNVSTEEQFADAISNGATPIFVENNITLARGYTVNYNLDLRSNGSSLIPQINIITTPMLRVNANGTLTITDIILDSENRSTTLIDVVGGNLIMNGNSIIRNTNRSAVKLSNNANFTMNSGLISGVDVASEAVFSNDSTFIMNNDATLANNSTAGVSMLNTTFTMTGQAKICDNNLLQSAGAVLAMSSTINMGLSETDSVSIYNNVSPGYSGGLYLSSNSVLNMVGNASIYNNTAVGMAGGIGLIESTINMSNNAQIYGNTCGAEGGGVALTRTSTLVMNDNATIRDNTTTADGGGVVINRSNATLNNNARIINNTASNRGGGVYIYDSESTLSLSDNALISDNTASEGNGIYNNGTLNIADSVNINDGIFITLLTVEEENPTTRIAPLPIEANVPIISSPLTEDAQIVLNESEYVNVDNTPLVVATANDLPLTTNDLAAFILPTSLNGYQTTLSDDNSQVLAEIAIYQIAYNNLFGSTNPNPTEYTVNDLPITLENPEERLGYTFEGWTNNDGQPVVEIPLGSTGDLTLNATWNEIILEYTITFDGNGENVQNIPEPITAEAASQVTIPTSIPLREGYLFQGWEANLEITSELINPGQTITMPDSDFTLVAQWQLAPQQRTITFDGNGENVQNIPEPITAEVSSPIIIPTTVPRRLGYRFQGWRARPAIIPGIVNPGQSITMPNLDITLIAQWQSIPQNRLIIFYPNGNNVTNMPTAMLVRAGTATYIPNNIPRRVGYRFNNWGINSTTSSMSIRPGQSILMPSTNLVLYARWNNQ